MYCRQSMVPRCLKFIPISYMGPKHAPKDTYFFSTNLYAPEHVHVVQIWIMHINALKTQLMHKNVQTNPEKSQKFTQHSCYYMLTREKNLKAIRGNGYRFFHKGGTFPTEKHHAWCEKVRFVRSIDPNLPQMGQNLYHGMLMPVHDSMPSFMNFRRVLDLLEFKNKASQYFVGNQWCPGVWNSFPFLAWDLSMNQRT